MAFEPYDVAALDIAIQLHKRNTAFVVTQIGQRLQCNALGLEIIEDQLITIFTFAVDAT
jgi:hypothetical protein